MFCKKCNKESEVKNKATIGSKVLYSLSCKHAFLEDNTDPFDFAAFKGKNGVVKNAALYPYQVEACNFVVKTGGRCLLNLDMGLGKTNVSLISTLKMSIGPVLILTRSSLKVQTVKQTFNWIGEVCQVIESPKDKLLQLNYFIMSMDIVRKFSETQMRALPFKTIIIDECQHIKNLDSQRTQAVMRLCESVPHVIALSATPIKNRFDEYFPILNILYPDKFPSYNSFVYTWCETIPGTNKIGGCRFPKEFKEATKNFIIRFEKDKVLPDLPKLRRDFQYYDLEKDVKKAYEKLVAEFTEEYEGMGDKRSFASMNSIMGYLAKMRHLTGFAKVKPAAEFVEDYLLSRPGKKITIFTDHIGVAEQIQMYLTRLCADAGYDAPVYFHSGLNAIQRSEAVEAFRKPNCPIMIASTKAAGEGLDLQFCDTCVFVERQWNPVNEEQAEGRFSRPGSTAEHIQATYLIALGTIDEWLTEIVENKRAIVKSALDGSEIKYNESDIMAELADKIVLMGRKTRWSF